MAKANGKSTGGPLGFEAALWAAADKLRGHMDAAEYKHVVLGLVFLKYISMPSKCGEQASQPILKPIPRIRTST